MPTWLYMCLQGIFNAWNIFCVKLCLFLQITATTPNIFKTFLVAGSEEAFDDGRSYKPLSELKVAAKRTPGCDHVGRYVPLSFLDVFPPSVANAARAVAEESRYNFVVLHLSDAPGFPVCNGNSRVCFSTFENFKGIVGHVRIREITHFVDSTLSDDELTAAQTSLCRLIIERIVKSIGTTGYWLTSWNCQCYSNYIISVPGDPVCTFQLFQWAESKTITRNISILSSSGIITFYFLVGFPLLMVIPMVMAALQLGTYFNLVLASYSKRSAVAIQRIWQSFILLTLFLSVVTSIWIIVWLFIRYDPRALSEAVYFGVTIITRRYWTFVWPLGNALFCVIWHTAELGTHPESRNSVLLGVIKAFERQV